MSDDYIELEVSEGVARFNRIMILSAVLISVLFFALAIITMGNDSDTAGLLAILGFFIMIAAIFIYYIVGLISHMQINNEFNKTCLLAPILIVVSLLATFLLVIILSG